MDMECLVLEIGKMLAWNVHNNFTQITSKDVQTDGFFFRHLHFIALQYNIECVNS